MKTPVNTGRANSPEAFGAGVGPLPADANENMMFPHPDMRREGGYLFLTISENNRLSISTTIEALINLMDAFEVDPDFEDEPDLEPSLGWTSDTSKLARDCRSNDHRHIHQIDREYDDSELELSLGAPENHPGQFSNQSSGNQEGWFDKTNHGDRENDGDDLESSLSAPGYYRNGRMEHDLEQDLSDDEHGGDDEPSLGWGNIMDQSRRVVLIDMGDDREAAHTDAYVIPRGIPKLDQRIAALSAVVGVAS